MIRWTLALLGLALLVFALAALSGPGRIDIDDGQARYEAGRCWIEYGQPSLRDPRIDWHRFPGRDGLEFSYYRLTGEVVAAAFAGLGHWLADTEGGRHFFFSLNGAATAALLAIFFAIWFRRRGLSSRAAIGWAFAGIVCTPCWFYATSTFDDLLCTLTVVAALVFADGARNGNFVSLLLSAMAVGLSLNSKQPLAAVILPAIAFADSGQRGRLFRMGVLIAGLVGGFLLYSQYENWKFPPEQKATHAAIWAEMGMKVYDGNPAEALLDYAIGPSSGALWYCPTILLGLTGLAMAWRSGRRFAVASILMFLGVVTVFYAFLSFYKGGVCWGPRYLTPLFGVLWLFAPDGARRLGTIRTNLLLALGFLVQLLALATIPERLYVARKIPSGFYTANPWWYFHPQASHLLNRPQELLDAMTAPAAPEFTPGPSPTFTLPVFDPPHYTGPKGIEGVRRYTLLNNLRPWWATFPHLPPDQRPVPILDAVALFIGIGSLGVLLLSMSLRSTPVRGCSTAVESREFEGSFS